jgi:hypothetical protein
MNQATQFQWNLDKPEEEYADIMINGNITNRHNVRNSNLNKAFEAFGTIFGVNEVTPVKIEQGFK